MSREDREGGREGYKEGCTRVRGCFHAVREVGQIYEGLSHVKFEVRPLLVQTVTSGTEPKTFPDVCQQCYWSCCLHVQLVMVGMVGGGVWVRGGRQQLQHIVMKRSESGSQ